MITNPVTNLMLQGRLDKQPIRRGITRVKELLEAGVNVSFGQDCVNDTFYPLGCADMLQVANVTVHAAQMSLPHELEKVFDMITTDANKIMNLPAYGLEEGCDANLCLLYTSKIKTGISQTDIGEIVLVRCLNILPAFHIVAFRFLNNECLLQERKIRVNRID